MNELIPAEVSLPGDYIKMELDARGWTQADLAEILGRAYQTISDIINGKCGITPETATGLAAAFGTTAQVWMNLQTSYDLWHASRRGNTGNVSRRAQLYSLAPVAQMIKRGWIKGSNNVEVLEQQILEFFEIESLGEKPRLFKHAARKSTSYQMEPPPALQAWLFRAKHLARIVNAGLFSEASLEKVLGQLKQLRDSPEELRHVPQILAEGGIRFMVIEPLPQTKIDGACLWLDDRSPVMALSLRYDRIDWFWHTLVHELAHIGNRDGDQWDDLFGEPIGARPKSERAADLFAVEYLVPQDDIEEFIARIRPLYSKPKILQFAVRMGVHPGIIVGQLQHRTEIGWTHCRDLLAKVRHIVTESTLTDGWGHMIPPGL